MTARALEFLIPGDLASATGGYGYDRRIIAGLGALGWRVTVHALDASFPAPDAVALARAAGVLDALPAGSTVLIDGLALGVMPQVVGPRRERLRLLALVHHPLAAEGDAAPQVTRRLLESERAALQAVRHVIVTSEATAGALARDYGVAPGRITVVPPGTDAPPRMRGEDTPATDAPAPGRPMAGAARAAGAAEQDLHLLCVATVTPRKGHELLLEALSPLAPLRWRLCCVGSLARSPATVQRLRARLRETGLAGRVRLAGEVPQEALARHYRGADLCVLPSLYEGYGMVVAEALSYGVPVIGTRTGAVAELIGDDAGCTVVPGDADALRVVLERLLREPARLAVWRQGARRAAARLPRWPQSCARLSAILGGITD